jgi:cell division protein FtsB
MDEIIKQSLEELIAERDALKAENETLKHSFIFENSVSKVIHERLKLAYDLVVASNRKLSDAIDVQANRTAELSRQLVDLRRTLGGEE